MFGSPAKCRVCKADFVLRTIPGLESSSGDCSLSVTPHYILACPKEHARAPIDSDYGLRCQEWLIDDELLQQVVPAFGRASTCQCPAGTAPGARQDAIREHQVTHRFRGEGLISTVRFACAVVTCAACGRPRNFQADFRRCWEPLGTP
jgi:hypothetical protein